MSIHKWALVGLGLTGVLGVSAASASNVQVERYGRVYARPACARAMSPRMANCHAKVVTDARGTDLDGKPDMTRNVSPSGLSPQDLHSAYKLGTFPAQNTVPSGPLIAIVDAYGYSTAEADLAVYRAQFGLPPCTTANGCFRKMNQNGGTSYPRNDTGWSQEAALDLDMVSAACPSCKIVLVEAASNSLADLGTAVNTAASLKPRAISNSYGGSEYSGETTDELNYYKHLGMAVTVSSGDSGYGVQFPAASQYVIAVGGTHLTGSVTTGWSESAWSGAGSGCSAYVTKPTWQKDACGKRTVADVSAVADPNTGVAVYGPSNRRGSSWLVFGGTSVAAPLIGGIYGLNSDTVSYAASLYSQVANLKDITSGSNGTCSVSYLCNAVNGYDGPTGLGTPVGPTAF